MAWINGVHEISVQGTLPEFFEGIKNSILQNTDFSFVEDESTELKLVFNTSIADLKITITDNTITDSTVTTTSSSLKIGYAKNSVELGDFTLQYIGGSAGYSTNATRNVRIFAFKSTDISYFKFCNYNTTTYGFDNTGIGLFKSTIISTGEQVTRYMYLNKCYDVNNLQPVAYVWNKLINNRSCDGVFMTNSIVGNNDSTSAKIIEYCNNIYNCTNLTPCTKYKINSKNYYAIDTNTLFEDN